MVQYARQGMRYAMTLSGSYIVDGPIAIYMPLSVAAMHCYIEVRGGIYG